MERGPTLDSPGLLQGHLFVREPLSIVYMCYLVIIAVLTPFWGALYDVLSAGSKSHALVFVFLAASCVGPIVAFVLLSPPSPANRQHVSWTAVVAVGGGMIVAAETLTGFLLADLSHIHSQPSSDAAALLNGKASLVGVGLATLLVGAPNLILSMALGTNPQTTTRYACISTVLVNLTASLCIMFARLCFSWDGINMKRTQRRQQVVVSASSSSRPRSGAGTSEGHETPEGNVRTPNFGMIACFRALRPGALACVISLSPPFIVRFLFVRMFYQGGIRCLAYLATTYILQNLDLKIDIACKAVVVAFATSLLGMSLTLGYLSAQYSRVQKQQDVSRLRRASSASTASALGAAIAAARVEQDLTPSFAEESRARPDPLDAPELPPLGIALAVLIVACAAAPTDVADSTDPLSAFSRDEGMLYSTAGIVGFCVGFISTYEKGVLASTIWPNSSQQQTAMVTQVGVGTFCGILTASSVVLEWLPTVLFSIVPSQALPSATWTLSLYLGLCLLLFALCMVWSHLKEKNRGAARMGRLSFSGAESEANSRDHTEQTVSERVSGFLLRSLPSHLSTIIESPVGQRERDSTCSTVMPASFSTGAS